MLDPGEQCDAGSANADTGDCTPECALASCGDGLVRAGLEECDDGNADTTDACLPSCERAICGDGVVQAGVEECDDGFAGSASCLATCVRGTCGDGMVALGVEGCDDGNRVDGDDCDADCDSGLWTRTIVDDDGEGADGAYGNDISISAAGGVVVAVAIGPGRGLVRSYTTDGEEQWTRRFVEQSPDGLATDADGSVYVAGWAIVEPGFRMQLQKLEVTGESSWLRTLDAEAADDVMWGGDAAVDASQGIVVLIGSTVPTMTVWVRAYDLEGEVLWTRTWPEEGMLGAVAAGGGRIFLSGADWTSAWVRALDPTGEEQWFVRYDATAAQGLALTSSGGFVLGGYRTTEGWNAGLDADGGVVWTGTGAWWTQGAAVGPEDDVVFVGSALNEELGDRSVWLARLASDGADIWTRTFDGEGSGNDDFGGEDTGSDVAVDAEGFVYVVGTLSADYDTNYAWIRKYPR